MVNYVTQYLNRTDVDERSRLVVAAVAIISSVAAALVAAVAVSGL